MTYRPQDDVQAAALIQIAAHAEQIASLDARVTAHHEDASEQIEHLAVQAEAASGRIDALTVILGRHAALVNMLDGLDGQVAALASQLAELTGPDGRDRESYQPGPAPRWWRQGDSERDAAVGRLRAWVEQVYQPGYGHLAGPLPPCWELHPLCLYTLDWLSELWAALYLDPERAASTLAGQAEWQTRLLPAAATQMARDTAGCQHGPGSPRRRDPPAPPAPGRPDAPRPR